MKLTQMYTQRGGTLDLDGDDREKKSLDLEFTPPKSHTI